MDQQQYLVAKKANDRAGLSIVLLFFIWLPAYLWGVRPLINSWLAAYISGYPLMLHIVPIFVPLGIYAFLITKFFPAPKERA